MPDRASPLQNRVRPDGVIEAVDARGALMGNRGGRLHDAERRLGKSQWKSKAWITCLTSFKGRRRIVMAPNSYTELFFLDEATSFAAGHRPCFECRRDDAVRFRDAWAEGNGFCSPIKAGELDAAIHAERVGADRGKKTIEAAFGPLPDGAMFSWDRGFYLKTEGAARRWSFSGYGPLIFLASTAIVVLLTPPSIVNAFRAGYRPLIFDQRF